MKPKKKLNLFDKIIVSLNILLALLLLLSYLAPGTDPRNSTIIAILGFGYQVLLFLNLLFVAYWLIRRKGYVFISVASILAGFTVLSSFFGFHTKALPGKKDTSTIRMMAYNVHGFEDIEWRAKTPSQISILEVITEQQPDIINIEEYVAKTSDSGSICRLISKALNSHYYYFKPYRVTPADSSGIAIFSRYPILKYDSVPSPSFLNTKAIFIDIQYRDKIIRVYCIHLAAVDIQMRDKSKYLNGDLDLEKTGFIKSRLSSAFIERSHQVSSIKRHMEKCTYPVIIAGDFNDTPNSFSVNEIGDGLKNAFAEKGSGLGVTYYSKFPKLQIDYILVSPQFDVMSYQAIDKKISDHYPLVSDFKLK